ncbi:tape measure protein [Halomonas sp. MS1]|nr:tape measure protein [Halomonas sp. MS1]UTD55480.1 tape measure protein [Halomonas sp. MS1]
MSVNVGSIYYEVDVRTEALLKAEKDVDNSSRRMEKRFDQTDRTSRRMSSGFDHAGGAALRLRNIVTAVSSAMATRAIINYSDAWGRAQNQLRQVAGSAAELRDINQQLMDISNRSAVAFENTAGFYARVAQATRGLNIEQSQLVEFVDLTSKSLRANGASAAGASALILQLSQAFSAGILQGEEFNSIIDQAPLLLDALQRETGKGTRELKKIGSDGELSIQMLIRAVSNYSDEINRRAAESTNTFADNLTIARNNMIEFVGSSDSAQGVVGKLGESVIYLSNNLEAVTQGAIALSAVIAGRYATSLGAAAIANISLAGAHIRRMQALRAEAQASNQAATAKVAELQASRAIIQSTIREIEVDRAALAATLNTNQAKGTQIAIKRELVAMDNALAAAKGRLVAAENAEAAATITANVAHKANASTLASTTRATQIATRAVGGLRTVMAFLGGPVGVIALAAYGIYSFREELGLVPKPAKAASEIVDELRQRIDGLSESALKFEMAGFTAELFRLQLQAERTKSRLEELQPETSAINGNQGPREALRAIDRRRDNAPEVRRLEQELEQTGNDIEARQRILEQIQEQLSSSSGNKPPVTPPSSSTSKADSEAKRRASDFDAVKRQLETEREAIAREYEERNRIIRESTAAGSAEQVELLERSANERENRQRRITEQLLSGLRSETEEIKAEYERRRQEILNATAPGAEQDDLLERNRQARDRETKEHIGAGPDPLTGGQYDDQFARYERDAEIERERYQAKLERLQQTRAQELLTQEDYNKREQEAAQVHADRLMQIEQAKSSMMVSTASNMFGDLSGLAKGFAGEQSSIYRAMFAASKAFAIADAAVKIQQGIANAAALPWPANLGAIASTVAATTSILGAIQSTSMPGYASGGYTGSGSRNEPAGIVHRGEFVMPKRIVDQPGVRAQLEAMRLGFNGDSMRPADYPINESGEKELILNNAHFTLKAGTLCHQ